MEKQSDRDLNGILLVNKPGGVTSHDVVDMVRRKLGMRRVGHAGTLDPLAEGLLIVLVGKSTKLFEKFVGFDKEYFGILKLGEVTTTCDSQGEIVKRGDVSLAVEEKIKEAFAKFEGSIEQIPPMVSALRINGKRLYKLARKGITVDRQPRKINIYKLVIEKIDIPYIEFYAHCSKGTYIRKLAEDIGDTIGCGAHIVKIKRLSVGPYKLQDAVCIDDIDVSRLAAFNK